MGLAVPKRLFAGVAPTTQTLEYTVPANTRTIITSITITNRSNTNRDISIWIVPNGESETDPQWAYLNEFTLAADEIVQMTSLSEVMEANGEIWIEGSFADAINVRMNGTETSIA